MNEQTKRNCELLVENRDHARDVFTWDGGLIHLACAGIFTARGTAADENVLDMSRKLLNKRVGIFSNFRSAARAPIAAMLAVSGSPECALENGLAVYGLLKQEFWTSAYLPLASMMIAQAVPPLRYGEVAARTGTIYHRMKAEHPFLTSAEDSAFCALMALSEKSDDELIGGAEECYRLLKPDFFSGNAVQSLSHALALCDGAAAEKCGRTMELYGALCDAGRRYGTGYELPTLGVLAMSDGNLTAIAQEMTEIDGWLSGQKGFGFFSSVTAKQLLMYSGIVAMRDYFGEDMMQAAAVSSTVSLVVAQQAALCAALASSAAAASASSSR